MFKMFFRLPSIKFGLNFFSLLFIVLAVCLTGCSKVHLLKPPDGATFTSGQAIEFEGEITRSIETGGADRSDDLSWNSSINGHIGDGRRLNINTLGAGRHSIAASWPNHNRSDSISIQINP